MNEMGNKIARKRKDLGMTQSDFAEELQSPEERLMVILGVLRGALSIGMVYIVVFGLVIAAMVLLWT